MTAPTPRDPLVEVVAKVLLDEGAAPGSSLHSWRCEHPDRYGECSCVEEIAVEVVDAVLASPAVDALVTERVAALADEAWQRATEARADAPRSWRDVARWLRREARVPGGAPTEATASVSPTPESAP